MVSKKSRNTTPANDERRGRVRFVDQPGQWTDTTPASVKKKQAKEWEKLQKMMVTGKKQSTSSTRGKK